MGHEIDELGKLGEKKEVFAPDGDFEAPAKEFIPGPYYMAADEVMPELGMVDDAVAGDKVDAKGKEFPVDRRDFMRLFSATAMFGAASCVRRPAETAIPYVKQPIDFVPGVANYYATTCGECPSACGVVVKTREGRPVKLEGSGDHPISQGGLCGVGQASIQGLYHPERMQSAYVRHGQRLDKTDWQDAYKQVAAKLTGKSNIAILTGGSTGHRHGFFRDVLKNLGSREDRLYTWESNSLYAATAKAHELAFGQGDLPRLELRQARYLVGIGTDFLEVGTSPLYHAKSFSQSHSYRNGRMGKFVQFESHLSLTGTSADERHVIAPGSETLVSLLLVKAIYENSASKGSTAARAHIKDVLDAHSSELARAYQDVGVTREVLDEVAASLLEQPSVIICGGTAFGKDATLLQLAAIMGNVLIGAYGRTLLFDKGWMKSPVVVGDMQRFLADAGNIDVLFVIDTNPIFAAPPSWQMRELLQKIPVVISIQAFPNEVDDVARYVLPNHHYLEAWGDEQPVAGFWSARQPAVRATNDTRQAEDSLLWILAYMEKSLPYENYRAYLKDKWHAVYDLVGTKVDYDTFFDAVLRRGFIGKLASRTVGDLQDLRQPFKNFTAPTGQGMMMLVSPFDHRLLDGRTAHLPILQEIGDGLTTIAWDTWAAMNPKTMQRLGLKQNQVVQIEGPGGTIEVALYPMPGLHPDVVVVPRGNGHKDQRSTISYKVGVNPLHAYNKDADPLTGEPVTSDMRVKVVATSQWYRLAAMQKHNDIANRKDIIKKVSLSQAKKDVRKKVDLDTVPDLYPKLPSATHRWGMSIDLSKCHGCGACMVACALENNIPQVGREQILMGREMHWLRLDRYFYGDVDAPTVTFQPLLCQHCNHAPCEPVCPVFATTHDPEGLNSMTYNRCVGTRYCANACPYKIRRFNWWTHRWGDMAGRPQDRTPRALNPDVTVRTRGIMEKCSFCVQRLREAKHNVRLQGRELRDGEVKTACQQTCPSEAIVFGNLNDQRSQVARERQDARAYLLLNGDPEHGHYGLKTLPNVNYLAVVTHAEQTDGHGAGAADHAESTHGEAVEDKAKKEAGHPAHEHK